MNEETTADSVCTNCGAALAQPRPRFCSACGQETNIRAPKFSEFAQQLGGAYFSTEGAIWRTLALLVAKPGELTKQYLAGRRKHYVLPLRLYMTISLIVLLAMRIATGLAVEGNEAAIKFDVNTDQVAFISFGDGRGAGMREGKFFCEGLPQWVCKRIERRSDTDERGLRREVESISQRFVSNIGVAMFAVLPIFALLLKLSYWRRGLHYTEHMVMALHVHAFWFLALVFTLADAPWISGLVFCAIPLYTLLAMRRVYGGRWWPLVLRALLISLAYFIALMLALAVVGLWTVIF